MDCSSLLGSVGPSADQTSVIEHADPVVKRVQILEGENEEERQKTGDMDNDSAQEEVAKDEEPRHKRRRLTLDMSAHSEGVSKETKADAAISQPQKPQQPHPETGKASEIVNKAPIPVSQPPHPPRFSSPIVKAPATQQSTPSLSQTHHIYSHPTPQSRTLNLRTLAYLLHPPTPRQKRNYICDIIGVISWISPQIIKRPSMPPKRDLRIIDPTILADLEQRRSSPASSSRGVGGGSGKDSNYKLGMALSVFVDAAGFNPPQGTVALFRTLRTHEWEGTSLNAYEIDSKGKEWFVTDSRKLAAYGVDVDGLRRWWLEVRRECVDACK